MGSAQPYANLHLAPDRYHASTTPLSFYSIKTLKAHLQGGPKIALSMPFKHDLDRVKVNKYVKYTGQRTLYLKAIVQKHILRRSTGPLKW